MKRETGKMCGVLKKKDEIRRRVARESKASAGETRTRKKRRKSRGEDEGEKGKEVRE